MSTDRPELIRVLRLGACLMCGAEPGCNIDCELCLALSRIESGDPGVAVAPPRQALVQAIRRAEDQQTILDLCDQLDKQFDALRQELGERDKFRDEIYKPQLALLREQLTTLEALWAEVGQHIDAAAIGYNHPQIRAVFTENRRLSADLAALRAVAPPPQAAMLAKCHEFIAGVRICERDHFWEGHRQALCDELEALRAVAPPERD